MAHDLSNYLAPYFTICYRHRAIVKALIMVRQTTINSKASILVELRQQLAIALPIISFIALFEVIMISNTMLAGRVNSETLAVIGVTQSVWMLVFLAVSNITSAINPLTATAHAQMRTTDSKIIQFNAFIVALALAPIAFLCAYHSDALLTLFQLDARVEYSVLKTVKIFAWALPPSCLIFAIRFFYEGISYAKPLMFIQGLASLLHLILLWTFVRNNSAIDDVAQAIAYCTVITMYFQLIIGVIWLFCDKKAKDWRIDTNYLIFDARVIGDILRIGLPIGLLAVSEVGFFVLTNILAARFHPNWTAAHVLTMSHLTLIFMIPLGLANAVSVRVARAKAIDEEHLVALRGNIGIALGCVVLLISAMTLWFIPERIARIYTNDPIVISYAASLMAIAAVFQLFDAIQVTTVGALRGIQDTLIPSLMAILSYWGIGAPAIYYFAFRQHYEAMGLWFGLLAGLVVAATLLLSRWYIQSSFQKRT